MIGIEFIKQTHNLTEDREYIPEHGQIIKVRNRALSLFKCVIYELKIAFMAKIALVVSSKITVISRCYFIRYTFKD